MFKKKTFFNIICSRFFIVLASKNEASITIFSDMFRKRRFCENSQKSLKKKQWFLLIFQGRSPQKSTKNRCQNAFERNIAKNDPKIDFGVRVVPKTSENRSKITKNRSAKRCGTTPVSRRYGNHPEIVGN